MKSSEFEKLITSCIQDENLKNHTVVRAAVRAFLTQIAAFGPIDICLTGSRFFGGVHDLSDWNFLVDCDQAWMYGRFKLPALRGMSVDTSFLSHVTVNIDRVKVRCTFRGVSNVWEKKHVQSLRKSANRPPPTGEEQVRNYWCEVWQEALLRSSDRDNSSQGGVFGYV